MKDLGLTCQAVSAYPRAAARVLAVLVPILLITLLCAGAAAQEQAQANQQPDSATAAQQREANSAPQGKAGLVGLVAHKSVVFPDLASTPGPLTPVQKFELFVNNSIGLGTIAESAAAAGINQGLNQPAGYRQGAEGYGKRFGASMASGASSNFFGTFLLASALHQDPRFFVKPDLSLGDSVKYAITRVFVTRSDSGNSTPNVSGLGGSLASEALANTYLPENKRNVADTFSRFGWDLAWGAAGNLARQYWPRINKRLKLLPQSTTSPR